MNVLDLLFPKRCLGCGRVGLPAGKAGKYFCGRCSSTIRIIEDNDAICPVCEKPAIDGVTHPRCQGRYAIDGLTSFFHYEGVVREAIRRIKYQHVFHIAEELLQHVPLTSHIFQSYVESSRPVLIPIPLHQQRFRYRGFNQAAIFATILGKRFNLSVWPNLLIRTKQTLPQVEVKQREKRLKNMEGVFRMKSSALSNQLSVVFLVDDVFTTGATMRSAANVIKRTGVKFVWGLTIAR